MKSTLMMGVFGLALLAAPSAVAEDWEAVCLEEVKTADVPPEVTQDQINTYCSCYASAIDGNAAYEDEVRALIELPREERGDKVSEELAAEEVSCQEEALGE